MLPVAFPRSFKLYPFPGIGCERTSAAEPKVCILLLLLRTGSYDLLGVPTPANRFLAALACGNVLQFFGVSLASLTDMSTPTRYEPDNANTCAASAVAGAGESDSRSRTLVHIPEPRQPAAAPAPVPVQHSPSFLIRGHQAEVCPPVRVQSSTRCSPLLTSAET